MSATLDGLGVKPSPIHVIVDEAQDLPKGFFQYLRDFTAITITVFADEDQALTEERSTLRDIKVAAGLDDPILLTGNHRNTPEIARVAEQFHSGSSPIPDVHREPSGELPRIISYRTATAASERIGNWYKVRGGRVGVVVVNNRAGADIHAQLRNLLPGQRVDFYSGDEQNENDIDLLEPGITILNEKSIKGQEFDTVFIMEIDKLLPYTNDVGGSG